MERGKGNIVSCQTVLRFIIAKQFDDWKAGRACPSFDRRTKMHPDSASLHPNHRKVRPLPRGKQGDRGDSVSECGRISENPCTITMQSQLDHSARHFCASRIAAATRTSSVSTISAGHCRTTSVPGAWRLAQDSARVAVKIDALICRAERDRVAELHIVAEQSEFYRGPACGVHHAVIDAVIRGSTDRRGPRTHHRAGQKREGGQKASGHRQRALQSRQPGHHAGAVFHQQPQSPAPPAECRGRGCAAGVV